MQVTGMRRGHLEELHVVSERVIALLREVIRRKMQALELRANEAAELVEGEDAGHLQRPEVERPGRAGIDREGVPNGQDRGQPDKSA